MNYVVKSFSIIIIFNTRINQNLRQILFIFSFFRALCKYLHAAGYYPNDREYIHTYLQQQALLSWSYQTRHKQQLEDAVHLLLSVYSNYETDKLVKQLLLNIAINKQSKMFFITIEVKVHKMTNNNATQNNIVGEHQRMFFLNTSFCQDACMWSAKIGVGFHTSKLPKPWYERFVRIRC